MELFATIHTAKELLEFLQSIPEGILEDLPVQILIGNEDCEGPIDVTAYEVRETQGCLERGFRLSSPDD